MIYYFSTLQMEVFPNKSTCVLEKKLFALSAGSGVKYVNMITGHRSGGICKNPLQGDSHCAAVHSA